MSWFDILKIGGEDFGTDKVSDDLYGDTHKIKTDYFYHKPSIGGFTRPHFEAQVLGEKGQGAVGNLQDITRKIKGKRYGTLFYGFTDPENSSHVVSFRMLRPDTDLTGSSALEILRNRKPTPAMWKHKNGTILFDSIYPTKGMDRISSLGGAEFYPIWGTGDYRRLNQVKKDNEGKDESIGRTNVVRQIEKPSSKLTLEENQEYMKLTSKQTKARKKGIIDDNYRKRQARLDELKRKRGD